MKKIGFCQEVWTILLTNGYKIIMLILLMSTIIVLSLVLKTIVYKVQHCFSIKKKQHKICGNKRGVVLEEKWADLD